MTVKQEAIADGLDAASTERAAQRRLESSGYEALKAIRCRFRRGTLFLTGEAPSYFHKQLAQEAIRTLAAVNTINNQIAVNPRRLGAYTQSAAPGGRRAK
jgi:hypothetical protein